MVPRVKRRSQLRILHDFRLMFSFLLAETLVRMVFLETLGNQTQNLFDKDTTVISQDGPGLTAT